MLQSEDVRTPGDQTQHFECRSSDESTLELLPNTFVPVIIMTIIMAIIIITTSLSLSYQG